VLREGRAADALVAAAREEDADLLVVGNRGLGVRRIPIGNVPARVIHRAPGTVLIVHTTDSVEGEPYRKVLIATDGSPAAMHATTVGGALANAVGAGVRVVTVGNGERGAQVLVEAARALPRGSLGRTVSGNPAGRIVEVAEDEGCDLIVIGTRGAGGARRFVPGIPGRVARRASCHVLVVKGA
jgi:nucleotide-binding universal stress UspA family protein